MRFDTRPLYDRISTIGLQEFARRANCEKELSLWLRDQKISLETAYKVLPPPPEKPYSDTNLREPVSQRECIPPNEIVSFVFHGKKISRNFIEEFWDYDVTKVGLEAAAWNRVDVLMN